MKPLERSKKGQNEDMLKGEENGDAEGKHVFLYVINELHMISMVVGEWLPLG